jgi:hypothetical protein
MAQEAVGLAAPAQGITESEREQAAKYLAATRDGLVEAVRGLSDAQWNFKPAADRWSIAQAMEHMAIIEGRVQDLMGRLTEAPADFPMREVKQVDAFVLYIVPSRAFRIRAPERVAPPGRWTGPVALEHFLEGRKKTFELLDTARYLRGRILPHPVLGSWDGYQWILAAAGHVARHTEQIREVKAHPNFPAH